MEAPAALEVLRLVTGPASRPILLYWCPFGVCDLIPTEDWAGTPSAGSWALESTDRLFSTLLLLCRRSSIRATPHKMAGTPKVTPTPFPAFPPPDQFGLFPS